MSQGQSLGPVRNGHALGTVPGTRLQWTCPGDCPWDAAALDTGAWLAVSRDSVGHVSLLEPGDFVTAQLQLFGCNRIGDVQVLRRADDRRGDARLVQQPRECDLCGRDVASTGRVDDTVDHSEIDLGIVERVAE